MTMTSLLRVFATSMIALSFAASIGALVQLLGDPVDARQHTSSLYDYASAAGLDIHMNVLVAPLSFYMCLIVSGVSILIHTQMPAGESSQDSTRRMPSPSLRRRRR